jgi:hypothetical protein
VIPDSGCWCFILTNVKIAPPLQSCFFEDLATGKSQSLLWRCSCSALEGFCQGLGFQKLGTSLRSCFKMEPTWWVHGLHNPGKRLAGSVVDPIYRLNVLIINGSYLVIKADLADLGLGSPCLAISSTLLY